MPVRCPHCQVPLTRDEAAAESCPACGGSLKDAPAAEETVREGRPTPASRGEFEEPRARPARREFDDDDFDDRPIRRSYGSGLEPGWRTTQAGINTMFWGYITVFISIAVGFALLILAVGVAAGGGFGANNPGGMGAAMGLPMCLMALGVIGGGITYLVGMFMCLTAPEGKAWMGGTLAFLGVLVLITVARTILVMNMVMNMRGAPANVEDTPIMKALAVALTGVGFLFTLFLIMFFKRIAQYFGNSFLNVICNVYLGFYGVYVVLAIGVLFGVSGLDPFMPFAFNPGGGLGQTGAIILGILIVVGLFILVLTVLHGIMLRSARNTIARAGAGPGPDY